VSEINYRSIVINYRIIVIYLGYRNESDVGVGVKKSGLPRSDVFIVTKLWQDSHGYENCKAAFMDSLKKLVAEKCSIILPLDVNF